MNYVLSFVFEFDLEDDVYYFAYWYLCAAVRMRSPSPDSCLSPG